MPKIGLNKSLVSDGLSQLIFDNVNFTNINFDNVNFDRVKLCLVAWQMQQLKVVGCFAQVAVVETCQADSFL